MTYHYYPQQTLLTVIKQTQHLAYYVVRSTLARGSNATTAIARASFQQQLK